MENQMEIQVVNFDDMKAFDVTFETDTGVLMCQISANNLDEAIEKLKRAFPNDIGADGVITDQYGTDYPLNW